MNKKTVFSLSTVLILLLLAGYWVARPKTTPELKSVTVSLGDIEQTSTAVGNIVPTHVVQVKSPIDGLVDSLRHQVGDKVKQGDLLLKVRPNPTPTALSDAQSELDKAQSTFDAARTKYDNIQSLLKDGVIPPNYGELVEARSTLSSARASLQNTKQQYNLLVNGEAAVGKTKLSNDIFSPVSGTIIARQVEEGDPVISTSASQTATVLMSIANLNQMQFKGTISESDTATLKEGMEATLEIAAHPETKVTGTVSLVALQSNLFNQTDSQSQTSAKYGASSFTNGFTLEIGQLKLPDPLKLRSGLSATATIVIHKANKVLLLPERALKFKGKQAQVLIPDSSQQGYHSQDITLGISDGINVEIKSGLKLDDKVIDNSLLPQGESQ